VTGASGWGQEEWDRWEERIEDKLAKLGTRTPRCRVVGCDETFPLALTGTDPNILCYEHEALLRERPWLEDHHPAGRHNDPWAAATPGNDHRILSALQYEWPSETLRNPDGSPLLRAAAALRGWLDLLWLVMVRAIGWIPVFLEQLDADLRQRLGERWWEGSDDRR
jgi:hypothetical protein